ncbi:MAG TPA: TrkA family potassium uptake protein [Candidatus Acutalibacter pullicola]|uniref:Trk system potassium uptake protein TrkA n=1 Tax=Candidatus Acutalibacter pullicola TaxID=2838417 RepID=A0A9D2MUE0_9FIRM|nr:TrkA family potassium uptake protein [Candidatus Acutalibacter pullicola]
MRMIIVGGGKAGWNLARILLERRHTVSLIERDRQRCEKLADDLDAAIFRGDGTNVAVLEAAGAQNADCFMAVTGSDQDNLVACQVAQDHFHAKKVISRVNDPRNIETFCVLGIRNTVSSTEVLTKMIEQEADLAHMHLIATLNQGKAGICSMTLPEDTALDGVALKDISLPAGTLVISLIRRGVLTIPNGSTILQRGDELVAVSEDRSQKALMRALAETVR